jgi:hypothetical protein
MNKYIQDLKVGDFDPKNTYRKPQMTLEKTFREPLMMGFFLEGRRGLEKIDQ